MEVSMSKTRRGKYIDNRICHKGKCKGDMRFNLRGKGKILCFSYLCEGNHFRFIEERYKKYNTGNQIVGKSGCFGLNLSDNSVMRERLHARRTLKGLVADLRGINF